ncbi:hypothetical protein [Rhodococcus sp. T2V]|uniref:hypothetical protein n=1 Tax=Rhodococcus sp. T2V TaxID=3034164 RepID=UPI0023E2189E|nr:hypothetical protein [Rhodococcus sp. T2V]
MTEIDSNTRQMRIEPARSCGVEVRQDSGHLVRPFPGDRTGAFDYRRRTARASGTFRIRRRRRYR